MASLSRKLRIKPGQRALVLNPPPGFLEALDLPDGVDLAHEPDGSFDFVHLFVKDSAELEAWGLAAREAVIFDGLFWISYPKGSSKVKTDLNRDVLWL